METEIMTKIDLKETIKRLRTIFARFGLPLSITADFGRQLISDEHLSSGQHPSRDNYTLPATTEWCGCASKSPHFKEIDHQPFGHKLDGRPAGLSADVPLDTAFNNSENAVPFDVWAKYQGQTHWYPTTNANR